MKVEFSVADHVAEVQLNRPDALNALDREMEEALFAAWTRINADDDIWSVILCASGERAFSIGADLGDEIGDRPRLATGGGITGIGGPQLIVRKPIVAAVQGFCVGGGFELAMCADIIVAADNAQFGLPETKVGVIGECGVVHRAVRHLPYHIAMQLILTGDRIKADEARGYGLVNEVVTPGELDAAARQWAARLNKASPLAVQAAKAAVNEGLGLPLEVALARSYAPIEAYARTADANESAQARREGRRPSWSGR